MKRKHLIKIALILLAGATVNKMVRKDQDNIFPMICSEFENGTYLNNGHTEVMHTANQIVIRPYQR